MLLKDKNGIKCDICGQKLHTTFIYYSYDCHKVTVDVGEKRTKREGATDIDGSIIGFDICNNCHKLNVNKMLENQT